MRRTCGIFRRAAAFAVLSALLLSAARSPALAEAGRPATVTAASLTVYATDSLTSRKLGTLRRGDAVTVLSSGENWAEIAFGSVTGWCAKAGLSASGGSPVLPTPKPTAAPAPVPSSGKVTVTEFGFPALVTAASLTVYAKNSLSSQRLGTLKKGSAVTVLAYDDNWACISYGSGKAFCARSGLKRDEEAESQAGGSAPSPTPAGEEFTVIAGGFAAHVTASSLAVYASDSSSSGKLGTAQKGQTVTVLAFDEEWACVAWGADRGFVKRSGLAKGAGAQPSPAPAQTPPPSPTPSPSPVPSPAAEPGAGGPEETPATDGAGALFTATVVSHGAKVYESKSLSARSKEVPLGSECAVYGYDADWANVSAAGLRGYMRIADLSRKNYDAIKIGEKGKSVLALQKALLDLGWFDGVPDGDYGSLTQAAVRRFSAACSLGANGNAGTACLRILAGGDAPSSPLLGGSYAKGSKGDDVLRIQTRLFSLGYFSKASAADGEYGSVTERAVALFAEANSLGTAAACGPALLRALYSQSASPLPDGTAAADSSAQGGGAPSQVKLPSSYVTEMPSSLRSGVSQFKSGMTNAQKIEYVIYTAQQQLGKPYVYGTQGLSSYDCSGLTQYCFKQVGVSLGRSAYAQGYSGSFARVQSIASLRRGDIACFNTISDSDLSDHVGICLGGNCFLHASSGAGKVVVSSFSNNYYARNFSWGLRILP